MRLSLAALLLLVASLPAAEPPVSADHAAKMEKSAKLFQSDVRAILEKSCLRCHGGKKTESEFDLGTREKLLKGGHAGPAVVPGDAKASLLYKLATHAKEPHMPEGAAKLPDASLAKLAEWIDLGAAYDKPLAGADTAAWTKTVLPETAKGHWAFQPLREFKVQSSKFKNPIDGFVREKLTAAKLTMNPPAEKRTLIRRAYFDLIGLPPTPEEVAAFEKDESPDAFEKVIDTLLASPHYGERWARHWLDLVRFAESHGFEHDYDRPTAYHYRDFVIKALNQDLPFHTFARWQIAGDEYAPDNPLAQTATGYLAAGVHSTQITANEVAKHRYDELDDIVNNIGTTFLGLSVGCARCHDHKFDPIPARDYYRMVATFTTTVRAEADVDFDPAGYRTAKAAFETAHAPYRAAVAKYEAEQLPARFAEWEAKRGDTPVSLGWVLPEVVEMKSAGGATLTAHADGSVLVTGTNPNTETLTFKLKAAKAVHAIRLEALAHPSLVKGGPGRAANGNFALSDLSITTNGTKVKLKNPAATFEQKGLPVAAAIDDNPSSAWAVDPQFGKDHAAAFDFAEPTSGELVVTLKFNNNTGHGIGRPRLAVSTQTKRPDLTAAALPEAIPQALATPAAKRTPEQTAKLLKWFAPQDDGWKKLSAEEQAHTAKAPKPKVQKALISTEGVQAVRLHTQGEDFLKETHFLRRGDPLQMEGVAAPSYLQALMPSADAEKAWWTPPPSGSRTSYRRRALAEWLTDVDRGAGRLVARVIVNRLWQHHFGRGIVSTVSDFGTRGEPPTHPELLDFLATELIRNGWQLKPIHKLMLTSTAYLQASGTDDAKAKADPENKLVGRFPVRRLDAEAIRDSILAVSGQLDRTPFGPGSLDENSKRRSVYFTMKRSKLIPALAVFDAPDGTVGVGDRSSTTIAPQALHLMNNPQVRAAAKAFAKRVEGADAVPRAYRLALSRSPTAEELADATEYLKGATLADFCQILFCLNEFAFVE